MHCTFFFGEKSPREIRELLFDRISSVSFFLTFFLRAKKNVLRLHIPMKELQFYMNKEKGTLIFILKGENQDEDPTDMKKLKLTFNENVSVGILAKENSLQKFCEKKKLLN